MDRGCRPRQEQQDSDHPQPWGPHGGDPAREAADAHAQLDEPRHHVHERDPSCRDRALADHPRTYAPSRSVDPVARLYRSRPRRPGVVPGRDSKEGIG